MGLKVVKFGGSSLANVESIRMVGDIINNDEARRFVVVSAPGKCSDFPYKVTDLLIDAYACHNNYSSCGRFDCPHKQFQSMDTLSIVFNRFRELGAGLGVDINQEIERTREEIMMNIKNYDFVVSRGEYLMVALLSRYLGFKSLDSANYIVIKKSGKVNEQLTAHKFSRLVNKNERVVMGGFYGSSVDGNIKTFSRGGSDYSGAIASIMMRADMYENFTDTYGVQTANPSIVKDTKNIRKIDYKTMHRLSVAGASVIHPDCLPLLRKHNMTLKVDNTFDHGHKFTIINSEKGLNKYFCITYKFAQNINKDVAEIFAAFDGLKLDITKMREVLKGVEVYLVAIEKKSLSLITPTDNLTEVVNKLHEYFINLEFKA